MTEHKSKLAQALEARKPHRKVFENLEIPGIDGGKICFQLPRNDGTTRSLTEAYKMREEDSTGKTEKGERVASHPDVAGNERHFNGLHTIATLYHVSRDPEKPDDFPAFPSPRWMRANLQNHEITYLTNLYNSFVAEVYPGGIEKLNSTEELLNFARACAVGWKTDAPDLALKHANFSHEVLAECFIRLAVVWEELDRENKTIVAENLSLRAAGVVPKEEDPDPEDGALSVYAVRLLAETTNSKQGDAVNNASHRIVTKQQAMVAMDMLGWHEGSPAWERVIADV
jgi:hypothetical protein